MSGYCCQGASCESRDCFWAHRSLPLLLCLSVQLGFIYFLALQLIVYGLFDQKQHFNKTKIAEAREECSYITMLELFLEAALKNIIHLYSSKGQIIIRAALFCRPYRSNLDWSTRKRKVNYPSLSCLIWPFKWSILLNCPLGGKKLDSSISR